MNYRFDFGAIHDGAAALASGIGVTLLLSVVSVVLGLGVGIVFAMVLTDSGRRRGFAAAGVRTYVEIIRNTPFLAQLFLIYFALPELGLRLSAFNSALIAMTINLGAYCTEIVRAGIEAVHKSQREAAASLGMSKRQSFFHVVLPPALEKVYPSLVSQFTLMMLATSVVSQVSVQELTYVGQSIESRTFRSFEVYFALAVIYALLAIVFRGALWFVGLAMFARRRRDFMKGFRR